MENDIFYNLRSALHHLRKADSYLMQTGAFESKELNKVARGLEAVIDSLDSVVSDEEDKRHDKYLDDLAGSYNASN